MPRATKPKIWCPNCEKITVCPTISLSNINHKPSQRWYFESQEDIKFFKRARLCEECNNDFITVEVSAQLLTELAILRKRTTEIFTDFDKLVKKSKSVKNSTNRTLAKIQEIVEQINKISNVWEEDWVEDMIKFDV